MIPAAGTNPDLVSLTGYHVIQWIFFALCLLAFAGRAYIRYICSHHLLVEDWLMLFSLGCHFGVAFMGQLFLVYMYEVSAVENGAPMGSDFPTHTLRGVRAFGVMAILSVSGIWFIKLNFLLFFYRLGNQITVYRMVWWVCFVFNIGCGAGCFGSLKYRCYFGSMETVLVQCTTASALWNRYVRAIITAVLDVVSDFAILCFPIYILWKVQITLRKKIFLSAVFGMVGFTIAVTIVRGGVIGGVYKDVNTRAEQDLRNWLIFWFYVEFTVSYIIACIVSFRTLFVHNEQQSAARDAQQRQQQSDERRRRGLMDRMHRLHDSIMDTCRSWEGYRDDSGVSLLRTVRLPKPPSGRLNVDFSTDIEESFHQKLSKKSCNESRV